MVLELLEQNPDLSQREFAKVFGVSDLDQKQLNKG